MNNQELVAHDNPIAGDKVGYYGEKLALLMTHLGLGNCWVAGTYDQETRRAEVGPGQTYAVRFNDLGIAKMHFQIGAASEGVQGTWEWGEDGRFIVE